ncbi:hypothetical protein [Bartonella rattaustraliani]|uniref:hypothetical protein n=1 Tax=Bartonella rattaustraliani TaxID=481139 RepID=UPI0002DDCACF|nr:hypothetical protein [Bartonella rattaustraliani]
MIDRNYHTYEEHTAAEKKEREQRSSIGRGILAILLALFIIWFVFGFLGSFFEKSSQDVFHNNSTESSQTIISPRKDFSTTSPTPYTYKGTTLPSPYEQGPSSERSQPNMDQGTTPFQIHKSEKI